MRRNLFLWILAALPMAVAGCEELDDDPDKYLEPEVNVSLEDVALLLSGIQMDSGHLREVYDAVTSSSWNGYDEEYMMRDLFVVPGAGVGDDRIPEETKAARRKEMGRPVTRSVNEYQRPLRELIAETLERNANGILSKAGASMEGTQEVTPERYMSILQQSDIQIYWPYSEAWDGEEYPVITFDPDGSSTANVGYRLTEDNSGRPSVEEIIIDEEFARKHPVWVVNRNDDCTYTSLELLRMSEPEWGGGGGEIIVRPRPSCSYMDAIGKGTLSAKTVEKPLQTLILRDFTMNRNYDSWFAGASEFFVKIGGIDEFYASTEAELRLYNPMVTDFMIVVKRNQVGKPQPFNAVLLSDWTEQLTHCAFMIVEDDGGTRTSWNCSGVVKINSKSYGFEITFPLNIRDDIVWRGQLARRYIEENNGAVAHYGDVDLVFEIVEY
ncbi:MAG: hypothetical protein NC308_03360 [Clostridium sp.]|nr:hypothetical protein [Bacteroides sp.]MCM1197904.1 hypothetical protein [Clostridium sp.]